MNKYEINIDEFTIIKIIGSGAFAKILKVKSKKSGKTLVAKVYFQKTEELENIRKFIIRELTILMRNQHPTIVQFHGYSYKDFDNLQNLTIFMEYLSKGSLRSILANEEKALSDADYDYTKKQIIIAGIAKGMMELHSKNVFHRDLKPENILLDDQFNPRITDFGYSKYLDPQDLQNQSESGLGTLCYMAPEVMISKQYSFEADVYSFGILMYEVITSTYPYDELINKGINIRLALPDMVIKGYRPQFKIPVKNGLKELIEQCWAASPSDRPTFSDIYNKLSLTKSTDLDKEENIMKYCIDGVDLDEFYCYIDEIEEYSNNANHDVTELHKKIELLEESHQIEVGFYKSQIDDLNKKHKAEIQKRENDMTTYIHKNDKSNSGCTVKGKVVKANGLPSSDLTKPNTFTRITVNGQNDQIGIQKRTGIQYNTHDPIWNFDFVLSGVNDDDILCFEVFQVSNTMRDQCMAAISIPVSEIKKREKTEEEEFELGKPPSIPNISANKIKFGTITLELSCQVELDA